MSVFGKFKNLAGLGGASGKADAKTMTYWTTPWQWRDNDGMYVSNNGDVWLYRKLDVHPLRWEDADTKLELGSPLASLLYELADTSKDMGVGLKSLTRSREIHLLALTWEAPAAMPADTPDGLAPLLEDLLNAVVPVKAVVVGIKLFQTVDTSAGVKGLVESAKRNASKALGEAAFDPRPYEADRKKVTEICRRNGAGKVPDKVTRSYMESWYNLGRGPDATIIETRDELFIGDFDRLEFAAVMAFENLELHAPHDTWALTAQTAASPATVISIRGQLDPSTVSRVRVRRSQRRMIDQIEEEQASGDIERAEQTETYHLAQRLEQFIVSGREPLISNCSIVMARHIEMGVSTTYVDELRNDYGIELKPLEHRQLAALEETLPCGTTRANPFLQDVSIGMLAYAGLQGFSTLGDSTGVFAGWVDPEFPPCLLNPLGAPARERPPSMLIAGEPGSGKTMLMQTLAAQISLAGMRVIFINPKGFDTLDGLLEVVPDGERIGLSEIEREGGFFDPFRFVKQTPEGRQVAADIATQHILAVLGSRGTAGLGFTQEQEIALISGMREAAEQGATCVAHALSFVPDAYVREQVLRQASDPLFRLGIAGLDGKAPEPFADSSRLLLIEFDRPLDLPEKGVQPSEYTRTQRLAVAAVRLVTRSAMEILGTSGGGALFVDEAWMFLQSQEGLAALQSLGRLGRSQNILPVFATQRVDDLLKDGIDMQTYLSRVFVLQLSDEKEAAAALKLCQLEPRADRIAWLRQAGPQRLEDGKVVRGAMAVHMDLDGRHAAVLISIPEWLRRTLSSNPEEAKKRRAARQARRLAGSGSTPSVPPQPE